MIRRLPHRLTTMWARFRLPPGTESAADGCSSPRRPPAPILSEGDHGQRGCGANGRARGDLVPAS